jgi:predicted nucleotidyltransferase
MIFTLLLKAAKNKIFPLFERPYHGPECVVSVFQVDLFEGPNRHFDLFSKPDVSVECRHNKKVERTQVINNSYHPIFLWATKMPFHKKGGFLFTVHENDIILPDHVMGRAFITHEEAAKYMNNGDVPSLSIGENIGTIRVKLVAAPTNVKKEGKCFEHGIPDFSSLHPDDSNKGGPNEPNEVTRTYSEWMILYLLSLLRLGVDHMLYLLSLLLLGVDHMEGMATNMDILPEKPGKKEEYEKADNADKKKLTSDVDIRVAHTNNPQSLPAAEGDNSLQDLIQEECKTPSMKRRKQISMKNIMGASSKRKNLKNSKLFGKSVRKSRKLKSDEMSNLTEEVSTALQ